MATRTFPADRVVYRASGGNIAVADDDWVLVWADAGATVPAEITVGGEPVLGSRLRTDREGRLPLFEGPDGEDLLWGTLAAHPARGAFELAARGAAGMRPTPLDDELNGLYLQAAPGQTVTYNGAEADEEWYPVVLEAAQPQATGFTLTDGGTVLTTDRDYLVLGPSFGIRTSEDVDDALAFSHRFVDLDHLAGHPFGAMGGGPQGGVPSPGAPADADSGRGALGMRAGSRWQLQFRIGGNGAPATGSVTIDENATYFTADAVPLVGPPT